MSITAVLAAASLAIGITALVLALVAQHPEHVHHQEWWKPHFALRNASVATTLSCTPPITPTLPCTAGSYTAAEEGVYSFSGSLVAGACTNVYVEIERRSDARAAVLFQGQDSGSIVVPGRERIFATTTALRAGDVLSVIMRTTYPAPQHACGAVGTYSALRVL